MIKKDENHNNSFIGSSWEELEKEVYTPEEIAERGRGITSAFMKEELSR